MVNEEKKENDKNKKTKKERAIQGIVIALIGLLAFSGFVFLPTYFLSEMGDRQNLRNLPLPVKMLYYYDYIRQNLPKGLTHTELSAYIVLHDTGQFNYFEDLDKELGNIWLTNNSMTEFVETLDIFHDWFWLWEINETSDFLYDNLLNKIDYISDYFFTKNSDYDYDYAKSAIETIFSGRGDCEDYAMLAATFLEAAGFETIIGNIHDDNQSRLDIYLHHAFLWVKVENFSYPYLYADLWRFGEGEYEWLLLEPTYDVVYGEYVSWIETYNAFNFTKWEDIFQWNVVAPPGDSSLELNELIPSHE